MITYQEYLARCQLMVTVGTRIKFLKGSMEEFYNMTATVVHAYAIIPGSDRCDTWWVNDIENNDVPRYSTGWIHKNQVAPLWTMTKQEYDEWQLSKLTKTT